MVPTGCEGISEPGQRRKHPGHDRAEDGPTGAPARSQSQIHETNFARPLSESSPFVVVFPE